MTIRQMLLWVFTIGLLVALAENAFAQVQLKPGEALKQCATFGNATGNGVVCQHHPSKLMVSVRYDSPSWWNTFWGDGTAQSVLPRLCIDLPINHVVEYVIDRRAGNQRTRTIPCTTGRSRVWIITPIEEREA